MGFIERTGCIYKITNLKNGKVYIGQTVQSPPIKRWIDHYKTAKSNTNSNKLYEDMSKGLGVVKFPIKENYSQDDEVIKSIKKRYIEVA